MSYNQYYKQPDYTENLKLHYDIVTRQEDEHQKDREEVSQQIADAEKGIDPWVKGIEALGSAVTLTQSISKGLEARKQKKLQSNWNKLSLEEQDKRKLRYKLDKLNLQGEDKEALDALARQVLRDVSSVKDLDEAKKFIQSAQELSGSQYLQFQELAASETIQTLDRSAYVASLRGDDHNTYHKANENGKRKLHEEWIDSRLTELGYSDGIRSRLQNETNRLLNTGSVLGKNKASVTASKGRVNRFQENIVSIGRTGSDEDVANIIQQELISRKRLHLPARKGTDDLTPTQKATASIVDDLYDLGTRGKLSEDTLDKILTGKIDHPGGDNIRKAFFDKDGKKHKHILDGIEIGKNRLYDQVKVDTDQDYGRTFVRVNSDEKYTLNDFSADYKRLSNLPLTNRNEKLESLERAWAARNSNETTQSILEEWEPIVSGGNLDKKIEQINQLADLGAKKTLLPIANDVQTTKELTNFDKEVSSWNTKINKFRNQETLGNGALTRSGENVHDDLMKFKRRNLTKLVIAARKTAGPNVPLDYEAISRQNIIDTNDYWVSNGGGTKEGDGKEHGKYTVDSLGEYVFFDTHLGVENQKKHSNHEVKFSSKRGQIWAANNRNKRNNYRDENADGETVYNAKRRYNTVGGMWDLGSIANAIEKGPSKKQLYESALEGKTFSKLLGYQVNAILQSPDPKHKQFAKLYDLDKLATKFNPDQILEDKSIEAVNEMSRGNQKNDFQNLITQVRTQGLDTLSPKKLGRYFVYLNKFQDSDIDETQRKDLIRYGLNQVPFDY